MLSFFTRSIMRQLVITISGAVAILLIITSYFILSNISADTRAQITASIEDIVKLQAAEVRGFFEAKGQVVHSIFASPQVVNWFESYNQRLADIDGNADYQAVKQYFHYFSEKDSTIKSVFFGSENTHEYFDKNGRYTDAEYFTNKRPWWSFGLNKGRMYVTDPAVDQNDGTISATVTSPFFRPDGRLLGIGGIDILISTIGKDLLSGIKYQGQGQAFLMTDTGKLVFFPGFSKDFPPGTDMKAIDQKFSDSTGFSELQQQITTNRSGEANVSWQGEDYLVLFNQVASEYPQMDWKLGFMVPKQLIAEPVRAAFWSSSIVVLLIILMIAGVVWLMILPFMRRIKRLQSAMQDIAEGDGDLTKRIEPLKRDEIGLLVDEFNIFVDKIQQLVQQTIGISHQVGQSTEDAAGISQQTNQHIEAQKLQIDSVATAATELAQTSQEIAHNANLSKTLAAETEQQVEQGAKVVDQATSGINKLSQDVSSAAQVVSQLSDDTQSIGTVLGVIRAIAEQTNLLALNAAIEAARAGEQGRGFAVVADEVRTLASRTQESTANIENIISELQQTAANAVKVMQTSQDEARSSVELTEQVQAVLADITSKIMEIQHQTHDIADAVSQQTIVAQEVSENIENVRALTEDTVSGANEMNAGLQGLQQQAQQLTQVVNQFKA